MKENLVQNLSKFRNIIQENFAVEESKIKHSHLFVTALRGYFFIAHPYGQYCTRALTCINSIWLTKVQLEDQETLQRVLDQALKPLTCKKNCEEGCKESSHEMKSWLKNLDYKAVLAEINQVEFVSGPASIGTTSKGSKYKRKFSGSNENDNVKKAKVSKTGTGKRKARIPLVNLILA